MKRFRFIVILLGAVMLLGCVQGVKDDFDLSAITDAIEAGEKVFWTWDEMVEEYYRKQSEELDSFRFDSTLFSPDTLRIEPAPEQPYRIEHRSPFSPFLHKVRLDG